MKACENEQNLISGLKDQHSGIISVVYSMYAYNLGGYIKRIIRDDEIAEDLLQECFVKIWLNGPKYNPSKGRLFTWMLTIARNLSMDILRIQIRDGKRYRCIKLEDTDWNLERLLSVEGHQHEAIGIKALLEQLIPNQKMPLILHYLKGFTHHEIAEKLDIPIGTVKTRIRLGLQEIKKNLAKEIDILNSTAINHRYE